MLAARDRAWRVTHAGTRDLDLRAAPFRDRLGARASAYRRASTPVRILPASSRGRHTSSSLPEARQDGSTLGDAVIARASGSRAARQRIRAVNGRTRPSARTGGGPRGSPRAVLSLCSPQDPPGAGEADFVRRPDSADRGERAFRGATTYALHRCVAPRLTPGAAPGRPPRAVGGARAAPPARSARPATRGLRCAAGEWGGRRLPTLPDQRKPDDPERSPPRNVKPAVTCAAGDASATPRCARRGRRRCSSDRGRSG